MITQHAVDFAHVIRELERRGFTKVQIAKEGGVTTRSVNNYLKREREPMFSIGLQLVEVYTSVVGSTPPRVTDA